MALSVEDLIEAASKVDETDRRRLIEELAKGSRSSPRPITSLRGLGKEIWQGQDAQEYINQQRDSWAR